MCPFRLEAAYRSAKSHNTDVFIVNIRNFCLYCLGPTLQKSIWESQTMKIRNTPVDRLKLTLFERLVH